MLGRNEKSVLILDFNTFSNWKYVKQNSLEVKMVKIIGFISLPGVNQS